MVYLGLPIKMVIFHGELLNNQMVYTLDPSLEDQLPQGGAALSYEYNVSCALGMNNQPCH